jgi:hypothetical protein
MGMRDGDLFGVFFEAEVFLIDLADIYSRHISRTCSFRVKFADICRIL